MFFADWWYNLLSKVNYSGKWCRLSVMDWREVVVSCLPPNLSVYAKSWEQVSVHRIMSKWPTAGCRLGSGFWLWTIFATMPAHGKRFHVMLSNSSLNDKYIRILSLLLPCSPTILFREKGLGEALVLAVGRRVARVWMDRNPVEVILDRVSKEDNQSWLSVFQNVVFQMESSFCNIYPVTLLTHVWGKCLRCPTLVRINQKTD